MKDLMNVQLFLKKDISCCVANNCSNSSKNNPDKTEKHQQSMDSCYKPKRGHSS